MPQKLGGFEYAVEIPAGDDNSRAGMLPVVNTEADGLQHHLAPYVPYVITTTRRNSDFLTL